MMTRKSSFGKWAFTIGNYSVLTLLGVLTFYPFLNLLAISLNDSVDAVRGGIYIFPRKFTWFNYEMIFQDRNLLHATFISVSRTLLGTALSLFATTLVAYTLSRRQFVLRRLINTILVVSLYVNGGLIPYYLLIKDVHLNNTFLVYLLPTLINAFNTIIIRSYFEQLPEGLIESAQIDGASDFQVLFRIVIFVSAPVLATIALFISVNQWNMWFDNFLFNHSENLTTLQYHLQKIMTQTTESVTAEATGNVDEHLLRSVSPQTIRATLIIIVTIPVLFVYPFMQNFFIKGITVGSMKE